MRYFAPPSMRWAGSRGFADAEAGGGGGHELREALRAGRATGVRVEVRLLADEAAQQRGVDAVARGRGVDLGGERRRARRSAAVVRSWPSARSRSWRPAAPRRRRWATRRRRRRLRPDAAPARADHGLDLLDPVDGDGDAHVRSPAAVDRRGPSRRARRSARWASAAWCSARWRSLRRSRTSRRRLGCAERLAAGLDLGVAARDRELGAAAVGARRARARAAGRRSSAPSSGAPARRASCAWRDQVGVRPRSTAAPRTRRVRLAANSSRAGPRRAREARARARGRSGTGSHPRSG